MSYLGQFLRNYKKKTSDRVEKKVGKMLLILEAKQPSELRAGGGGAHEISCEAEELLPLLPVNLAGIDEFEEKLTNTTSKLRLVTIFIYIFH